MAITVARLIQKTLIQPVNLHDTYREPCKSPNCLMPADPNDLICEDCKKKAKEAIEAERKRDLESKTCQIIGCTNLKHRDEKFCLDHGAKLLLGKKAATFTPEEKQKLEPKANGTKQKQRKKELSEFSLDLMAGAIRLSKSDENGAAQCVSCGKYGLCFGNGTSTFQNGHFVARSNCGELKYELDNCGPQCPACNVHATHATHIERIRAKFEETMRREHGDERVDFMLAHKLRFFKEPNDSELFEICKGFYEVIQKHLPQKSFEVQQAFKSSLGGRACSSFKKYLK